MKRMHIHVAVEDLNDSIRFYSAMFGNKEPTVLKSGYCKWELTDPAVNFAISQRGAKPGVDHIGIQVETDAELQEMNARFIAAKLPVQEQTETTCCYARSDKAWTIDPQGVAWETFRTSKLHRSTVSPTIERKHKRNQRPPAARLLNPL
ncbi:glyoxalase/bleomycin resistance protein/dioxygenase [Caballeronia udeis]|uniref:Glyoxalase/bleomycin resistance protein/dioxygenase n=1 Tax=Caballeronia udeis TaxID=1232866 RepID=A0A158JZN9_9BURK|nr:glyoxalase/bleomycin resistance protein/dioxygenase [Caballeronia udeis]